MNFTESIVEDAALAWLSGLGYKVLHGPEIAAGEHAVERSDPNYRDVLLERRLRQALVRLGRGKGVRGHFRRSHLTSSSKKSSTTSNLTSMNSV